MKNQFKTRLTKAMKERRKQWAKKELERWLPYESWVETGNFNEHQLSVIRNTIENFRSIAEHGYVKTVEN